MAGKTSKASTQPPGEALSPKHEAFVQAYVSRGMNGTKAYRAVYPSIKSDDRGRGPIALPQYRGLLGIQPSRDLLC